MNGSKSTPFALIAMIMVYMVSALAAFVHFFMGLIWGSEVYRDRGMPLIEWVTVAGPLVATVGMLIATIILWKKGKHRITYALFAVLLVGLVVFANYTGLLAL